ncbi:hypothetical protein HDU93_009690 [Gonapodya sp. JEL0774]|nr:hypothetical protein HDU93_009690 [Gonapodya sp. JEL0774]
MDPHDTTWIDDEEMDFSQVPVFDEDGNLRVVGHAEVSSFGVEEVSTGSDVDDSRKEKEIHSENEKDDGRTTGGREVQRSAPSGTGIVLSSSTAHPLHGGKVRSPSSDKPITHSSQQQQPSHSHGSSNATGSMITGPGMAWRRPSIPKVDEEVHMHGQSHMHNNAGYHELGGDGGYGSLRRPSDDGRRGFGHGGTGNGVIERDARFRRDERDSRWAAHPPTVLQRHPVAAVPGVAASGTDALGMHGHGHGYEGVGEDRQGGRFYSPVAAGTVSVGGGAPGQVHNPVGGRFYNPGAGASVNPPPGIGEGRKQLAAGGSTAMGIGGGLAGPWGKSREQERKTHGDSGDWDHQMEDERTEIPSRGAHPPTAVAGSSSATSVPNRSGLHTLHQNPAVPIMDTHAAMSAVVEAARRRKEEEMRREREESERARRERLREFEERVGRAKRDEESRESEKNDVIVRKEDTVPSPAPALTPTEQAVRTKSHIGAPPTVSTAATTPSALSPADAAVQSPVDRRVTQQPPNLMSAHTETAPSVSLEPLATNSTGSTANAAQIEVSTVVSSDVPDPSHRTRTAGNDLAGLSTSHSLPIRSEVALSSKGRSSRPSVEKASRAATTGLDSVMQSIRKMQAEMEEKAKRGREERVDVELKDKERDASENIYQHGERRRSSTSHDESNFAFGRRKRPSGSESSKRDGSLKEHKGTESGASGSRRRSTSPVPALPPDGHPPRPGSTDRKVWSSVPRTDLKGGVGRGRRINPETVLGGPASVSAGGTAQSSPEPTPEFAPEYHAAKDKGENDQGKRKEKHQSIFPNEGPYKFSVPEAISEATKTVKLNFFAQEQSEAIEASQVSQVVLGVSAAATGIEHEPSLTEALPEPSSAEMTAAVPSHGEEGKNLVKIDEIWDQIPPTSSENSYKRIMTDTEESVAPEIPSGSLEELDRQLGAAEPPKNPLFQSARAVNMTGPAPHSTVPMLVPTAHGGYALFPIHAQLLTQGFQPNWISVPPGMMGGMPQGVVDGGKKIVPGNVPGHIMHQSTHPQVPIQMLPQASGTYSAMIKPVQQGVHSPFLPRSVDYPFRPLGMTPARPTWDSKGFPTAGDRRMDGAAFGGFDYPRGQQGGSLRPGSPRMQQQLPVGQQSTSPGTSIGLRLGTSSSSAQGGAGLGQGVSNFPRPVPLQSQSTWSPNSTMSAPGSSGGLINNNGILQSSTTISNQGAALGIMPAPGSNILNAPTRSGPPLAQSRPPIRPAGPIHRGGFAVGRGRAMGLMGPPYRGRGYAGPGPGRPGPGPIGPPVRAMTVTSLGTGDGLSIGRGEPGVSLSDQGSSSFPSQEDVHLSVADGIQEEDGRSDINFRLQLEKPDVGDRYGPTGGTGMVEEPRDEVDLEALVAAAMRGSSDSYFLGVRPSSVAVETGGNDHKEEGEGKGEPQIAATGETIEPNDAQNQHDDNDLDTPTESVHSNHPAYLRGRGLAVRRPFRGRPAVRFRGGGRYRGTKGTGTVPAPDNVGNSTVIGDAAHRPENPVSEPIAIDRTTPTVEAPPPVSADPNPRTFVRGRGGSRGGRGRGRGSGPSVTAPVGLEGMDSTAESLWKRDEGGSVTDDQPSKAEFAERGRGSLGRRRGKLGRGGGGTPTHQNGLSGLEHSGGESSEEPGDGSNRGKIRGGGSGLRTGKRAGRGGRGASKGFGEQAKSGEQAGGEVEAAAT